MLGVEISPIKARFIDPENCTALLCKLKWDNMIDTCCIEYMLVYPTGSDPSNYTYITSIDSVIMLSGSDYTSWSGDNNYVFTYVSSQLGLTLT